MPATPLTAEHRAAAPGLAAALRELLTGLATLIARGLLRNPRYVAVILPLWSYLNRIARRADRLMARIALGTEQPRPRPASPRAREPAARARLALPTERAWLLAALKHEAGHYTQRIEHLLSAPGTAEIIAAVPQAARLLRPLCRMLGVQHPAIPPRPPRLRRQNPPSPAFAESGREADRWSGPSRSNGKDEGGAAAPARAVPPDDDAPAFAPRPARELCPRLLTRWPFAPHPAQRKS